MRPRALLTAMVSAGLALAAAGTASASPSFARRYNVSCNNCHARAYPELNAFGRRFQENGYQLPEAAEQAARDRSTLAPGTIAERIGLWRELPISLRATGYVQVPVDAGATGRNSADLKLLDQLYLVGGGALFPDVSVFVSASVAPAAALHHASIGVHNLFGDGYLNLRAGDLLLFGFLRPEHRSLTRVRNLGATVRVGLNPSQLDTSHLGLEAYGRAWSRRLFYQLAVVQGARGSDGVSDLDSNKDVFGQLQLTMHDQQVVGGFGYYGRTQITDSTLGVAVRFTDPFWIAGGDLELHAGPVGLFGYVLYGHHDNPRGNGAAVSYLGMRGELSALLGRDFLALLRFDGVHSSDDATLERRVATAQLTYMLLTNLRVSAEFDADLLSLRRSTAFLVLDAAM